MGKVAPVSDRRRASQRLALPVASRALIIAASAVMIGASGITAWAKPIDRWTEFAAAHEPTVCARCRPHPRAAASVAEVVRRLRHEATPPVAAPARAPIDLAAELRHVAAADVDDQPRQAMRIADDLAPRDVRAGAAFAAALPPGRVQDAAMLAVVSLWMRTDRRAALEWAQGLAEEAARQVALHEVARRLVAADVGEARALAAGLPAGPGRDDALCAVARHWAKIDHLAALAWVDDFAESPAKTRMMKAVAE